MLPLPSLKSRIITSKLNEQRSVRHLQTPQLEQTRPKSYKLWSMDAMQEAIVEVERGMLIRRVAECYKIPQTTLQDYVSGQSSLSSRSGVSLLTEDEESELATFLIEVAKIGYPHTRQQVLNKVQAILDAKGMNRLVTYGWWQSFTHRHPELTLKSAAPLGMTRAKATDREVLNKDCLRTHDILNKPGRLYNCDETGLPLNPPCPKIVDKVGTRNPCYVTGNTKVQITVLASTSAAGIAIPPLVVMKKRPITQFITEGEVPGTTYGLSENGWMNREVFSSWFSQHFLQYAHQDCPILLLMDGHSSHYCPDTITLAAENQVILYALPPNTTHLTQPLDRACFSPLKVAWREECHNFCIKNPGKVVSRLDFSKLFSKAWFKAMTMSNVIAGFRVTGICPFDRSATMPTDSTPNHAFNPSSLVERTGLAYIPFYSPVRSSKPGLSTAKQSSITLSNKADIGSLSSPPVPSNHNMSLISSSPTLDHPPVPQRYSTSVSNFLNLPSTTKVLAKKTQSVGTVFTSRENLQKLQDKKKNQEKKEKEKQER